MEVKQEPPATLVKEAGGASGGWAATPETSPVVKREAAAAESPSPTPAQRSPSPAPRARSPSPEPEPKYSPPKASAYSSDDDSEDDTPLVRTPQRSAPLTEIVASVTQMT